MSDAPLPPHPQSATGREAAAKGAEEERGWTRSGTARTLGRGGSFAPTVVAAALQPQHQVCVEGSPDAVPLAPGAREATGAWRGRRNLGLT